MTTAERPPRLFHLLAGPLEVARRALEADELRPASLALEGFCHLSFADQLEGTLAAHFADADELVVLEVVLEPSAEPGRDDLVLEPARGGALFPHLYRPLVRTEVTRIWELRRRAGRFVLPTELFDPHP